MARPIKLTPEIEKKILDAIRMGNYLETAAAYANIARSTFYNWIKRGEKEIQRVNQNPRCKIKKSEKPFVDFKHKVDQALAEAEMRDVQIILRAASDDWRAAAWRLERRYPDKWSKKDRHEVTGQDGGPIEIKNYKETLKRKIESMAQRTKMNK